MLSVLKRAYRERTRVWLMIKESMRLTHEPGYHESRRCSRDTYPGVPREQEMLRWILTSMSLRHEPAFRMFGWGVSVCPIRREIWGFWGEAHRNEGTSREIYK